MKTKQLLLIGLFGCFSFTSNAQTLVATSAGSVTSTSSGGNNSLYVGSAAGNGTSTGSGNTFIGGNSGFSNTTGSLNTFVGEQAGYSNQTGEWNIFLGQFAGRSNTSGNSNIFTGIHAGAYNLNGAGNIFTGSFAGRFNTSGSSNIFQGMNTGVNNTTGSYNIAIGSNSALNVTTGSENICLGYAAGFSTTGSKNVFIGSNAGYYETGSEKLYIENGQSTTPSIWGDFAADLLKFNGKVGIGAVTTFPTVAGGISVSNYKLFVTGGILTDEVRVNLSSGGTWADYVFNKDYKLKTLSEVEEFIKENGHLPNVPSAAQVQEDGIALGEMAKIQQEKIEELTLYIIEQNKEIEKLKNKANEIEELKAQMKVLMTQKQ